MSALLNMALAHHSLSVSFITIEGMAYKTLQIKKRRPTKIVWEDRKRNSSSLIEFEKL